VTERRSLSREERRYVVAQRGTHVMPVYLYRRHRHPRLADALFAWCRALVRAATGARRALAPRGRG